MAGATKLRELGDKVQAELGLSHFVMKSTIGGLMDMLAERAIKLLRDEIRIGGLGCMSALRA